MVSYPPRVPDSKIADMFAELAAGGELIDEGAFTLDAGKARDKLRKFRLENPTAWVLLAVEAGTIGGAEYVDLDAGNDSCLDLEGLFLDKHELEGLLASVLVDSSRIEDPGDRRRAEALRLLALAVDAAVETGATRVVVGSTDGDRSHTLTVGVGEDSSFQATRGGSGERVFTRIIVDRKGISGEQGQRESSLLRERTRWADTDVRVVGERVSEGMQQALFPLQRWSTDTRGTPVSVELEDGSPIGWAGIRKLSRTSPNYDWLLVQTNGVLIEKVPIEDGAGSVAIVDVPVERDLSLQSVVRNEAWDRIWTSVLRARDRAEALRPAGARRSLDEPAPVVARPDAKEDEARINVIGGAVLVVAFVILLVVLTITGA